MTTIKDVALAAKVSKSTVSLALNTPDRVSPETLARIREAAQAVGYVVDPLAQTLASGRSRIIAMVVADISVPFFSNVLRELETAASESGYFVVVADSQGDSDRELALLDKFVGLRVAGVALSPSGNGKDYAEQLRRTKLPIVCFDNNVEGYETDFVGSENRLAGSMLTEHLLQLGHTRIAFIEGKRHNYTAQGRLEGYLQSLRARGHEPDLSLVLHGDYSGPAAYQGVMRLLVRPDRPTAIVAANNVMGIAALQAIQEIGLRCPEDISLAMVDDPASSQVIRPKPTMVVQDTREIGRILAVRLMARIEARGVAPVGKVDLLPVWFFPGGSSARPGITSKSAP
jgi:LacI family transcriptional regulator